MASLLDYKSLLSLSRRKVFKNWLMNFAVTNRLYKTWKFSKDFHKTCYVWFKVTSVETFQFWLKLEEGSKNVREYLHLFQGAFLANSLDISRAEAFSR